MRDAEFTAVVTEAGNPAMFGDWYVRSERAPNDSGKGGFTGRISIDLPAYLDAFLPGEIETRIETLKKQLPHALDVETVRELITETLTPHGWSSVVRPFATTHVPAWRMYLYRVRPGLDGPEDVSTVWDIWTPPTGTSPGRVNRRGQPILYKVLDGILWTLRTGTRGGTCPSVKVHGRPLTNPNCIVVPAGNVR